MKAVLKQRHPEILIENGGPLKLSKWFCKSFVKKYLNWTFRRATTAAQKVPIDWERQVLHMTQRLAINVFEGQIPRELLFSMDETFCFFVPMGHTSTLAQRGSKNVAVVGADDKRGCTVLVTTAGDGSVLPFQMIFGGKTEASLPKTDLRRVAEDQGHDLTVSESHWCTVETLKRWVINILFPAYNERCEKLALDAGVQECVLQFDCYKVLKCLQQCHCGSVRIILHTHFIHTPGPHCS